MDENLSTFVENVKKPNGENYTSSSLLNMVDMMATYLSHIGKPQPLRNETVFPMINKSLKQLRDISSSTSSSLSPPVVVSSSPLSNYTPILPTTMPTNSAVPVQCNAYCLTEVESKIEDVLFDRGILNFEKPLNLFKSLVWFVGSRTGLGASGSFHRGLCFQNLNFLKKEDGNYCIQIKTFPHWLKGNIQIHTLEPNLNDPKRCPVEAVKLYLSVLPDNHDSNCFYLRPLKEPSRGKIWFSTQPVGEVPLGRVIPELMQEATFGSMERGQQEQQRLLMPLQPQQRQEMQNFRSEIIGSPVVEDEELVECYASSSPISITDETEQVLDLCCKKAKVEHDQFVEKGNENNRKRLVSQTVYESEECSVVIRASPKMLKLGFTVIVKPNGENL